MSNNSINTTTTTTITTSSVPDKNNLKQKLKSSKLSPDIIRKSKSATFVKKMSIFLSNQATSSSSATEFDYGNHEERTKHSNENIVVSSRKQNYLEVMLARKTNCYDEVIRERVNLLSVIETQLPSFKRDYLLKEFKITSFDNSHKIIDVAPPSAPSSSTSLVQQSTISKSLINFNENFSIIDINNSIMDEFNELFLCKLCMKPLQDSRILDCLHIFCLECLQHPYKNILSDDNDFNEDFQSFNSSSSKRPDQLKLMKYSEETKVNHGRGILKSNKLSEFIICSICNWKTELPMGKLIRLPQNFMCRRMTNNDETSNCNNQKVSTNIVDIQQYKCTLHLNHELKLVCITCNEIVCINCITLLHRNHKLESIINLTKSSLNKLTDIVNQTRSLINYTNESIIQLNDARKQIQQHIDNIEKEINTSIIKYMELLEINRRNLLKEIDQIKGEVLKKIFKKQCLLVKLSKDANLSIRFTDQLLQNGNDIDLLTFSRILLNRFEYLIKEMDPNVAAISLMNTIEKIDSMKFLPYVRVPFTKLQNRIPIYGIITTQIVNPNYCYLTRESDNLIVLINTVTEITLITKDNNQCQLNYGGLSVNVMEYNSNDLLSSLMTRIFDNDDGTYTIGFEFNTSGTRFLSITINGKHIKRSPFTVKVLVLTDLNSDGIN